MQRLEVLEAEEQALSAELEEVKAEQGRQRKQLEEIGSLRRDYRRRGYHRGTFDVAAGAMLGSILGQVLGGAISRDDFWGEVSRHHQPPGGGWGGGAASAPAAVSGVAAAAAVVAFRHRRRLLRPAVTSRPALGTSLRRRPPLCGHRRGQAETGRQVFTENAKGIERLEG